MTARFFPAVKSSLRLKQARGKSCASRKDTELFHHEEHEEHEGGKK
jgi:hypothetical protein